MLLHLRLKASCTWGWGCFAGIQQVFIIKISPVIPFISQVKGDSWYLKRWRTFVGGFLFWHRSGPARWSWADCADLVRRRSGARAGFQGHPLWGIWIEKLYSKQTGSKIKYICRVLEKCSVRVQLAISQATYFFITIKRTNVWHLTYMIHDTTECVILINKIK